MQTQRADAYAEGYDHRGEYEHLLRRGEHTIESGCGLLSISRLYAAREVAKSVVKHPARDHSIEHHEQVIARHAGVFCKVKSAAWLFENIVSARKALAAAAADGEFAEQDRHTEQRETEQV